MPHPFKSQWLSKVKNLRNYPKGGSTVKEKAPKPPSKGTLLLLHIGDNERRDVKLLHRSKSLRTPYSTGNPAILSSVVTTLSIMSHGCPTQTDKQKKARSCNQELK